MPSAMVEPIGGVPDSIPLPVLEGPEVILGRRLGAGLETAPPPLPRVLSRAHQALRETVAAILREWEALETERQCLGDWCTLLEQRTKAVSCQFASERSELERGREDLREDLEKVIEQERGAAREERRLLKKKEHLDQREVVITEYHEKLKAYNAMLEEQRDKQTATKAALQKLQQELDDKAGKISLAEENLRAKGVFLEERASDLIRQEKELTWREEMWERRDKLLEKKLEERVCWFQAAQAAHVAQMAQAAPASQAAETMKKMLEDLQVEQRIKVQHITAWADEASSALVPLGVSPIPVSKEPVSISDALPVLDSAADRLRRLDQILGARLEAEGSRLCRAVIEYILTCFRSHDPAISLGLVIVGPVADTEDAARGSVQDAIDVVAQRFQRDPTDE
jgi:chromosome segregation ATPase